MAQNFFINKGSELPQIKMEVINDGRHDFKKIYLALQAADSVTFSMFNKDTGIYKIANEPAEIVYDEESGCDERYFIQYTWKKTDTDEAGRYVGLFTITFNNKIVADGITFPSGVLIVPIAETLYITISDSGLKR